MAKVKVAQRKVGAANRVGLAQLSSDLILAIQKCLVEAASGIGAELRGVGVIGFHRASRSPYSSVELTRISRSNFIDSSGVTPP